MRERERRRNNKQTNKQTNQNSGRETREQYTHAHARIHIYEGGHEPMMMMMMIKTREHMDIKNREWSPVLTMQICACSSSEFAEVEHTERENMMMV
jgi:hypothetical protein